MPLGIGTNMLGVLLLIWMSPCSVCCCVWWLCGDSMSMSMQCMVSYCCLWCINVVHVVIVGKFFGIWCDCGDILWHMTCDVLVCCVYFTVTQRKLMELICISMLNLQDIFCVQCFRQGIWYINVYVLMCSLFREKPYFFLIWDYLIQAIKFSDAPGWCSQITVVHFVALLYFPLWLLINFRVTVLTLNCDEVSEMFWNSVKWSL